MKKLLCAVAAASVCIASPRPAAAGGGDFAFGAILGLGIGSVIGSAVARPYPYAPHPSGYYPYGYYPYGYYPYAVPYAYPPVVYAPPGYLVPPMAASPAGRVYYAPPGLMRPPTPPVLSCRPGQFFNTLTGNCDRR